MENVEQLIDDLHLEDLRNEIHPSIFDDNEKYDMSIVCLAIIVAHDLRSQPMGLVMTQEHGHLYDLSE